MQILYPCLALFNPIYAFSVFFYRLFIHIFLFFTSFYSLFLFFSIFFIEESCKLVFIDINESRFPIREQVSLFDRVKKLDILPKTKIENDREIWEKWIEAQDILLKRNAQPFKVKRYHQPFEVKNDCGETTRYKFKVDLFVDDSSEYKDVEEELLNEFSINETFDDEGNIFLQFEGNSQDAKL